MKKFFKRLAAGAVGLTLLLAGCGSQSDEIRLGTGGVGGKYYTYGNAMAQFVEEDVDGESFLVKATAGSAANLRLMNEGFLQMAIVQSDLLLDAYEGTGVFADYGKCTGYSAVAGLYTEACQVVVPADSDIQTVFDLYGKTVSLGEEESGVVQNARQILQVYGLSEDLVQAKYLSFSDSAEEMSEGKLDAFFCTAGAPTTAVEELAREKKIRVLSLDAESMEKVMQLHDGYTTCVIPAGTYDGQTEDVTTLGVKAVLIASNELASDRVEKLTASLFAHGQELQYAVSGKTGLDMAFATKDIPGGFHPGAAAYYKDQDISVEVSTQTQGAASATQTRKN
jgi:TRAP transporter TAXI family solute receptor